MPHNVAHTIYYRFRKLHSDQHIANHLIWNVDTSEFIPDSGKLDTVPVQTSELLEQYRKAKAAIATSPIEGQGEISIHTTIYLPIPADQPETEELETLLDNAPATICAYPD